MNGDHIDEKTIEHSVTKRVLFMTFVIVPLTFAAVVGGIMIATLAVISDEL